ncbi:MAG: iron ABC transporter permease [Spirochaetaceae bacterium]|jgi:iron complex transport system permease protein|nr:iron ABC transporter permease [Spirochaetaceae bacterium]
MKTHTATVIQDYKEKSRKRLAKIAAGLCICAASFIADILIGPSWLTLSETFAALFRRETVPVTTAVIVWTLRLPAALMALGVGASLGLAGASIQTILDNPLASPYTLGISAGAGFGAALAVIFGGSLPSFIGASLVPVYAFSFSVLTCMLIYFMGRFRSLAPETMLLCGLGLSFLFQSLQSLLQYISSPEALQSIVFWLFGSLARANWITVALIYLALFVILPLTLVDAWKLTALKLGDEKARSLGINVERLRMKIFILISLLTSFAVCFVGVIGFIGLAGPHIARILVGEDQRFFIPLSAVFGAAILSAASVISKIVSLGAMLPIGIVTGLIGVPFYFSLIFRSRKRYLK